MILVERWGVSVVLFSLAPPGGSALPQRGRIQLGLMYTSCVMGSGKPLRGSSVSAQMSGDLKNPSKAIPFGTNLSIAVSTVVYFVLAFLVALVTYRSTPGIYAEEKCPYGGTFHDYLIMARVSLWPPMVYAGIFGGK